MFWSAVEIISNQVPKETSGLLDFNKAWVVVTKWQYDYISSQKQSHITFHFLSFYF